MGSGAPDYGCFAMNFQGVRQRGVAPFIAAIILLLWYSVLGVGAIPGLGPLGKPGNPGNPGGSDQIVTPGHSIGSDPGISSLLPPPVTVDTVKLGELPLFRGASGAFGSSGSIPLFVADLLPFTDGPFGTNGPSGGGAGSGLALGGGVGGPGSSGGPGAGGGGGSGGPGGSGDDTGNVECPMMPPASLQEFNTLVAAGCEWDGDGPGGPVTRPGPVDVPEDPDGGKGPDQGGLPNSPGNPTGNSGSPGARSQVPEAGTWVLMCVGTVLLAALHRSVSLTPSRVRSGSRRV